MIREIAMELHPFYLDMYYNPARYKGNVPVEVAIPIHTTDRVWYYIPGFNGYEISNDGLVRSMKLWRKFAFGIIVKPNIKLQTDNIFTASFSMVGANGKRTSVDLNTIYELAMSNPYAVSGYPRYTYNTDQHSRNKSMFIQNDTYQIPKFSVID